MSFESINPMTGEVIKSYDATKIDEIPKRIESLKKAQVAWKKKDIKERLVFTKRLYKLMLEQKNNIAHQISIDTGKSEYEAFVTELLGSFSLLAFYKKYAAKLLKDEKVTHAFLKNKRSYLRREAHGIVAIITPWNYPFYLSFSAILAALIAGNAVLFKPSEHTAFVGEELHRLFLLAGIPEDLFQIVYGAGEQGKAIVDADIQKVAFTGSVVTGQKIAAATAKRLIPTTLELGGKDPFVVCDDAPFERCVKAAVWGNIVNAGQTCSGVERIIVFRSISERFIQALRKEVDALELSGENRSVPSLNNEDQFKIVQKQRADAEKKSKEIIEKKFDKEAEGSFNIAPAFIVEVDEKALILKNETFGPLATIQIVDDLDEAIQLANKSDYGLTTSIWTKSKKRAKQFIAELDAGSVYVNDHIAPQGAGELPWGGFKQSGIGKSRGKIGLLAMTKMKVVSIERINLKSEIFWQPYSKRKEKLMKKLPHLFPFLYRFFA